MREKLCGVCNEVVSINDEQITRLEQNGSTTVYHMQCEPQLKSIKPCVDCGEHRLFCSECAEF